MSITVPIALAREQIPTIVTSFGVALKSISSLTRSRGVPDPAPVLAQTLRAPSARLVDHYAEWSGAPRARYRDTLPPHFCSHWAFAMLARLGGQVPYNLASILNQGLHLQVKAPLPRDVSLQLRGQLKSVTKDERRVRIHTQVITGTDTQPEALILDSYSAVPQRGAKGKDPGSAKPQPELQYETVGFWSVSAEDGINFALLTGDFNPLHTVPQFGRRTRFRGCILHGFGSIARTYEAILNGGFEIADLDARWIKPLPLPSDGLEVQVAASDAGRRAFRLRGRDGSVHLAGTFA
jgi:acyl dehydratase